MLRRFDSLADFLASDVPTTDGVLDDGFGKAFPVVGREVDATILIADISDFTERSAGLSAIETLIFVQNFFAWIQAEALERSSGIVDKYIGDAVMVVFSHDFGSGDPFVEAIRVATDMSRRDVHAYRPHMGIASGKVVVGRMGDTATHTTVLGAPVTLAARCAGAPTSSDTPASSTIVFPSAEWGTRSLDDVVSVEEPRRFELDDPEMLQMKGLGEVEVRSIRNTGLWIPTQSAEDRARESLRSLRSAGHSK